MKGILLTLTIIAMFLFANAQNKVYDRDGKHVSFTHEDIDINFLPSAIKFPLPLPDKQKEVAGSLLALLPTAVDVAFKATTKILENRIKKFSGEYSKQKSYLEAGNTVVPNFTFTREINVGSEDQTALEITVLAEPVSKLDAFVYYVDKIELNYSSAKTSKASMVFDYTIEIKATISTKGESKVLDLAPIVISSVRFGENTFEAKKHRTDLVSLPRGGVLTQISLKVIETNPLKIRAEKIASFWNDYKDEAKTIVNNFLPKEEETKDTAENTDKSDGNDKSTSNVEEVSTGKKPL